MLDTSTTIVVSVCSVVAALAIVICAASLAVALPWWPKRSRYRSRSAVGTRRHVSPVDILVRAVEALAITSTSPPTSSARSRDASNRCSGFAENQALPLRFQPEKLYGTVGRRSPQSSFSSLQSASVHRGSMVEALSPYLSTANQVMTKDGFLAPIAMRIRSGSTSLLHELSRGDYENLNPTLPIPVFLSMEKPQPESDTTSVLKISKPTALEQASRSSAGSPITILHEVETIKVPSKDTLDAMWIERRRKSLVNTRRTTLCTPIRNELGASLSELASIMGTHVSKSTHNSPSRMRALSSATGTPRHTTPSKQNFPSPLFTPAETPGGIINYRVFIDATGKHNLTVRLHLYSGVNIPSEKPWKNSNYLVKAALIGFKSHFVKTSGSVTAAAGSPRFSAGSSSVLDFVVDCGVPFNQSEEKVRLQLMIIEFSGRKPGDKSVVVATNEYTFSHQTLMGKSTLSTEASWKRCQPSIEVYQLTADVLTSLTQRESEDSFRFEMHEIRNMAFRLLSDKFSKPAEIEHPVCHDSLYPVKLRLRACLISNGKAIRVRKGFNIRLPQDFSDAVRDAGRCTSSSTATSSKKNSLVLKECVSSGSERSLTFRLPFPPSLGDEHVCIRAGMTPIQWQIVAFFVLILEDSSPGHPQPPRRARAIGRCCLGSSSAVDPMTGESTTLLSNIASESSQRQISQWLHIE